MKKQFLKLGTGAVCVSMGWALWVPFVISNRLGGAWAPWEIRLAGIFLLAAGAALLFWGLEAKAFGEWGRLFLFWGALQICLSLLSGFLAFLVLFLSGDNGTLAKEAADWGSAVLALPLHAWMLCLAGFLSRKGRFALWLPGRLFLRFLALCVLAALCQVCLSRLPDSTAGILAQGFLGGCLLSGILWAMLVFTDRYLEGRETQEEGGN